MKPRSVVMVLAWLCWWPGSFVLPAQVPKPAPRPLRVGILIYDGVFNTEFVAPLDVFQHAEARTKKVEVFTVAPHLGSVLTAEGLKVIPHRTFADAPNVDILVVPSGKHYEKDMHDPALVAWIRERSARARIVHANCWGAFLLGAARILAAVGPPLFRPTPAGFRRLFPERS